MTVPQELVEAAAASRRVVVLSGAGMSAESGVPTFRDAQTGLWERYTAEDLATPAAWERDADTVWAWYLWRFGRVAHVEPNAGHVAVAEWEAARGDDLDLTVVTQNVDDLHERAGSGRVVHLHGSLAAFRCESCDAPHEAPIEPLVEEVPRLPPPRCAACGARVRPGVVWFGELLPMEQWYAAEAAVEAADLVIVVGTSGIVHPAAGLPVIARGSGAYVAEINPRDTDVSDVAHVRWRETAAVALPQLVAALTPGSR